MDIDTKFGRKVLLELVQSLRKMKYQEAIEIVTQMKWEDFVKEEFKWSKKYLAKIKTD